MKILNASIADIIAKMERVSTEDMEKTKYCSSAYRNYHDPLPYRQTLLGTLDTLSKENRICIGCVRSIGVAEKKFKQVR